MFGFIDTASPEETELDEDILEALAEWFPQPPGFHPVILCCAKCGHLSKVTIDSEVSADDLAGWAMIHEECLK